MSDPLHPSSSPSSKPEKRETVIEGNNTINVNLKKQNKLYDFVATVIMQRKNVSIKDEKEIIKPQLSSWNQIITKSTENMSSTSKINFRMANFKIPDFLINIYCRLRYPSYYSDSFFGFGKMSDKKPGRPMKYPYTLSAKIAQFPFKFHINNSWMWKYYFIAVAVSFPLFYKLSKASNTPENIKKWQEIRKREFTPGGHH